MSSNVALIDSENLACILIAAGNSSRLGQPKQLVKCNGETLISRSTKLALNHTQKVCCVLGFEAEMIKSEIQNLPVSFLVNEQWQVGMGSSIACAVAQLEAKARAVLIMLCDQWALEESDIQSLVNTWRKNKRQIIASKYADIRTGKMVLGAPAIFPRAYFNQLLQLKEKGARQLLESNRKNLVAVNLSSAAYDLDTPEDLEEFLTEANRIESQSTDNNFDNSTINSY